MSKHTPGPWEIEGTPRRGWDIFSLGEERRYITSDPMRERAINYERDARLMAAAPELLEALEQIVEVNGPGRIYKLNELGMLVSTMLSIARAAIAKAKGEE